MFLNTRQLLSLSLRDLKLCSVFMILVLVIRPGTEYECSVIKFLVIMPYT